MQTQCLFRAGPQKFDLEYNVSTGAFTGNTSVWPMTLQAVTVANQHGVKPITWTLTMKRNYVV